MGIKISNLNELLSVNIDDDIIPIVDVSESDINTKTKKVKVKNLTSNINETTIKKVIVKPTTNNTTALQIQQADGTPIISADTVNKKLTLTNGAKFEGDGSLLTNILSVGTGGTSSTGDLQIIANSDSSGGGDIKLMVGSTVVGRIKGDTTATKGILEIVETAIGTAFLTPTANSVGLGAKDNQLYRVDETGKAGRILCADDTVAFLEITSRLRNYLKSQGYRTDDDMIIPHNLLPNNYAVIDKNGEAHSMVEIPRKNWDPTNQFASSTIHPAFMVNGVQKRVFIGKYQASLDGSNYVTRPNMAVKTGLTFDQELTAASGLNNGTDITGFHLMTNAEWALVQEICKANNYVPAGNNSYGRDADNKSVTGRLEDPTLFAGSSGNAKWYAGSGGHLTSHNLQESGIFDLNGNVWERVGGFRINEGEIQILENNNAADYTKSQASGSAEWKAILVDGNLVAPGTAGTLKLNGTNPVSVVDTITTQLVDPNSVSHVFENTTTSLTGNGIDLLKKLGVLPYTTGLGGDYLYMRNYGEIIPLRGGSWGSAGGAGVFALYLCHTRASAYSGLGFRFAFIL